jgi:hypothetical protein
MYVVPEIRHPNNIGGVGASWHDASDSDTIIVGAGNGVSQHRDKTGNARHRNQSVGANQPETGLDTINGHNVFRYTATSHMFFRAVNYLSFGDFTIFHAAKTDINGAGSEPEPHYISVRRPSGNFSTLFNILTQQPIRDIRVRWSTGATGAGTPGAGAIITNVPFLTVVKLVRNQAQGIIRVNGVTLASGFTYAPIEDDQPEIIWGSNFPQGNLGDFDGNEIENLIFPWALELHQIEFIENYYKNRYLLW